MFHIKQSYGESLIVEDDVKCGGHLILRGFFFWGGGGGGGDVLSYDTGSTYCVDHSDYCPQLLPTCS